MDALDRIEPVAHPLVQAIDNALGMLGAPSEHPIWGLLRRVGAAPGDAVAFVSMIVPDELRGSAARLRALAGEYERSAVPAAVAWRGRAADEYQVQAAALRAHLHDEMAGVVTATALYLDEVADWAGRARRTVAVALADVLSSAEAVTLSQARAGAAQVRTAVARSTVLAAADAGAHLLRAVAGPLDAGRAIVARGQQLTFDRLFHAAVPAGPARGDTTIDVRH